MVESRIDKPLDIPGQLAAAPLSTPLGQGQGSTTARAVAEALFRHRRAMFWTMVPVFAATLLYVLLVPRTYQSEMNILVRNQRPDYLLSPEKNNGSTPLPEVTEEKINSEIEVLKSKDVADVVVDPNWIAKPLNQRMAGEIKAHERAVLDYGRNLSVESLRKSNVIHVAYRAGSAREATQTVERLLDAFLAKQREIERSTGASTFFASEAERYKGELDEAQRRLAEYQQKKQLVSLPEKEATLAAQISQLEDRIRETQVAITESTSRIKSGTGQLRSMPSRVSTAQRSIPNTYTIEQLTTLLANLQNQRTALLVKFLPSDRMVLELNKQIADTSTALRAATTAKATESTTDVNPVYQQVRSSVAQSSTELRALNGRLADQTAQLARLKESLANVEGSTVDYTTLQTRVAELQANYQLYSQKRNEAEIADAMDRQNLVNVAVAERPTFSARPYRPEPAVDLSLGAFTAVFLAGCMVFFAEMGRDTVAAPYELEALTRIPVLATVPLSAGPGPRLDAVPAPPSEPEPAPGRARVPARTVAIDEDARVRPMVPPTPIYAAGPGPQPWPETPSSPAAAWFAKAKHESGLTVSTGSVTGTRIRTAEEPVRKAAVPTASGAIPIAPPSPRASEPSRARGFSSNGESAPTIAAARPSEFAAIAATIDSAIDWKGASAAPLKTVVGEASTPRLQVVSAAGPTPPAAAVAAAPTEASGLRTAAAETPGTPKESDMFKFIKSAPTTLDIAPEPGHEAGPAAHAAEAPAPPPLKVRDPIPHYAVPPRPSTQMRRADSASFLPAVMQDPAFQRSREMRRFTETGTEASRGETAERRAAPPAAVSQPDAGSGVKVLPSAPSYESTTRSTPKFFKEDSDPGLPAARGADAVNPSDPMERFITANSEAEPVHRPSSQRLAAIREEVQASRQRLSPSQRLLRSRPELGHDRYGRISHVTYTVDPDQDPKVQK